MRCSMNALVTKNYDKFGKDIRAAHPCEYGPAVESHVADYAGDRVL